MEISYIRAVIAIAEQGSITAAASQLFISPVSLMHQLNQLEGELGFAVFTRTRRGCTLTPTGNKLYQGLKTIYNNLDALITECKQEACAAFSTLRISIYLPSPLFNIIEAYIKTHPERHVQYDLWANTNATNRLELMKQRNLDLFQMDYSPELEAQGLAFCPIWEDRYCCYASPNMDFDHLTALDMDSLRNYRVVSFSERCYAMDRIEQDFAEHGQTLHRIPYTESTVLNTCSQGGIYLMEENTKDEHPYFKCIPLVPNRPCLHGLAYFSDANREVLAFIEYVKTQIGQENMNRMLENFKKAYHLE